MMTREDTILPNMVITWSWSKSHVLSSHVPRPCFKRGRPANKLVISLHDTRVCLVVVWLLLVTRNVAPFLKLTGEPETQFNLSYPILITVQLQT